ncbi:MAG: 4-alpha-glucanotransferase [Merismopedia sp. SIO2A8]|nr:4-alpha-glucanotransferase [Merismopedia sp. SIO2A8]
MPFPRTSGILLHPTSFPGAFGVGDVGGAAYRFIDFLYTCKQSVWQVLPLGPTGHGNSPYMSYSSMAGNPILISLEKLAEQGWLSQEALERDRPSFSTDQADYEQAIPFKTALLTQAAQNFAANATDEQKAEFEAFCQERQGWLDDYALFMALKQAHDGQSWAQWDKAIAQRDSDAITEWQQKLAEPILHHKFWQFIFFTQWNALRHYANQRGISILGDMPIYVAHDSADVWASPENFQLDPKTGEPALMAGVPPDYFSATGQLWGNPIFNWEQIAEDQFQWWIRRVKGLLDYVDIMRIDHFRGFQAYWQVEQGETTAINGEWQEAPGEDMFKAIAAELGPLPIIAEDLGIITPEVEALRDQFEFPGMKILHFAFGSDPGNPYLPFNYTRNCIVYTGTHDNDTTVGWFNQLQDWERNSVVNFLGGINPEGIHWMLIRLALCSIANQAIFPLQDLMGLGSEARMNTPGVGTGNWAWRYDEALLTKEMGDRLSLLTTMYGREIPRPPLPPEENSNGSEQGEYH